MTPAFADEVAEELQAAGATEEETHDYEHAEPSFMVVRAAIRYWHKHHSEEISPTR